jgi:hypothetical protein
VSLKQLAEAPEEHLKEKGLKSGSFSPLSTNDAENMVRVLQDFAAKQYVER